PHHLDVLSAHPHPTAHAQGVSGRRKEEYKEYVFRCWPKLEQVPLKCYERPAGTSLSGAASDTRNPIQKGQIISLLKGARENIEY
ncbi:unnamed protein product, partial [Larinioides sclopetarius]